MYGLIGEQIPVWHQYCIFPHLNFEGGIMAIWNSGPAPEIDVQMTGGAVIPI